MRDPPERQEPPRARAPATLAGVADSAACPVQGYYRPRRARDSPLYRLVEDHHETLKHVYDDRFARTYGFWRPEIDKTLLAFLDCGIPELGFARLRCPECRRELFVTFSCKTRGFCPACLAKRAALWTEWLLDEVLLPVRHHQWVFTLPKRIRPFFLYDRSLLGDLARCAFRTVQQLSRRRAAELGLDADGLRVGMAVSIQTYGDRAGWQPHLHALVTAGLVDAQGAITPLDPPDSLTAEALFQRQLLRLLERRGKLEPEQVEGMLAWPHSGFSVHNTVHADPQAPEEMARLGRYLLHPPISLERLEYRGPDKPCTCTGRRPDPRTGAVSEDCDPLEFLARLCLHIPPPRTHLTRLYGAYSTRHRVARRDASAGPVTVATAPGDPPAPNDPTEDHQPPASPAERRRRADWGRLLARVFEIDPLNCSPVGACPA